MSHYTCLTNMSWVIPEKILAMMLLSKAPSSMETIVQMYSQLLADATPEKVKADLIPKKIIAMMRTSWETHGCAGTSWFNQQRATKLSAVKPAGNQPPQFQYQQQQRGEYLQQQRGGWGLGGGNCENYAVAPLFFLNFSLFIARPPVLSTTLNCIIMLLRLLRQHVARAYGQDTLYWL